MIALSAALSASPEIKSGKLVRKLVAAILEWFSQNARDLPWRRTSDPYAIWVSEIMLQQTQVATVIPYWESWLKTLPDVNSLSRARLSRLYKLWEGLGYYRRVRHMQHAAKVIVQKHGGQFPQRYEDVLALPGIGLYTAGAICSIAFNQPKPVLDGNVARVLSRLFGIEGSPRQSDTREQLWGLAAQLVAAAGGSQKAKRDGCSHLNQGLMELGALLCKPRDPICHACPLQKHCVARNQNRVAELPGSDRRPVITARHFIGFVIESEGALLLRQRPSDALNGGLWEFPNLEVNGDRRSPGHIAREFLGLAAARMTSFCSIKHSITRYRMTLQIARVDLGKQDLRLSEGMQWVSRSRAQQLPFTSAHKKVLRRVLDACGSTS